MLWLVCRSLAYSRLEQWDQALADAQVGERGGGDDRALWWC